MSLSESEYEIERIVDVTIPTDGNQGLLYLVKWRGYPSSQNTWEPVENFGEGNGPLLTFQENNRGKIAELEEQDSVIIGLGGCSIL